MAGNGQGGFLARSSANGGSTVRVFPILPRVEYVSLQSVPKLEDVLLLRYLEGKAHSEHQLTLARLVFTPTFTSIVPNAELFHVVKPCATWLPNLQQPPEDPWLFALWLRVNAAGALFNDASLQVQEMSPVQKHRIDVYLAAHDACVHHWMDTGIVDPLLYESPGPTQYPEDERFVVTRQVVSYKRKPRALRLVQRAFPQVQLDLWTVANTLTLEDALTFVYHPLAAKQPAHETHLLYYASLWLIDFYTRAEQDTTLAPEIRDALYTCRVAYVDLFYHCLSQPEQRMDDEYLLSSVEGHETPMEQFDPELTERVFTGDDLPDMWSVVCLISLWGENTAPDFPMARVFSKTLPFSCQRRSLIPNVAERCKNDIAYWRMFSHTMWCALTGLYSHVLLNIDQYPQRPSMDFLLRAKELTSNRTLLLETFTKETELKTLKAALAKRTISEASVSQCMKERDLNCLVLFVAFRLYFLHMTHREPHYVEIASTCINWSEYMAETATMAAVLRTSNIFLSDAFASARLALEQTMSSSTKTNQGPSNNDVYRFRKQSCTQTIVFYCNERLRDYIYNAAIDWERDVQKLERMEAAFYAGAAGESLLQHIADSVLYYPLFASESASSFETVLQVELARARETRNQLVTELPKSIKDAILNLLVRIVPEERRKAMAIGALRLDRYGGISDTAVCVMIRMFDIYRESSLKQAFHAELRRLNVHEIRVVAWYFHVMSLLENISFAPLDYETTIQITRAMRHKRLGLHDAEPMPPYAWDVVFTLCCGKLPTYREQDCHGHELIAYDMALRSFTCAHKKHASASVSVAVDDDFEEAAATATATADDTSSTGAVDVASQITAFVASEQGNNKIAQKKLAADLRKQFAAIPCENQPVIRIPLRGAMLVMGTSNKQKTFYMRCPRCACFHQYDYTRNCGTSGYVCSTCAAQDPTRPEFVSALRQLYVQCEYCGGTQSCSPESRLLVMCVERDPVWPAWDVHMDPRQMMHMVQFCQRCYKIAKRYCWTQHKAELWLTLKRKMDPFKTRTKRIRVEEELDM